MTLSLLPTQNVAVWHSGNATQRLTNSVVHLETARTNLTNSSFKFKSLWIILIWHEVQLALHRNSLQRDTFYFYALCAFQNLYFITFTWIEKLSLFLHKYLYFNLRTCVGYFCHLCFRDVLSFLSLPCGLLFKICDLMLISQTSRSLTVSQLMVQSFRPLIRLWRSFGSQLCHFLPRSESASHEDSRQCALEEQRGGKGQ